jgi:DNA-binding transcriptional MocR family regulator
MWARARCSTGSSPPCPRPPGAYASYPTAGHDARLRARLAAWFSGPDHGELSPDDMVLTLGAQHALVVLLTATLHGPRPMIATEELAYPGIRHAAHWCGRG